MRLLRAYYLQVGPLTGDTSTLLLPSQGELFQQRFVVGDQRGLLQVVSIKRGQSYAEFQTNLGAPIQCLALATHSATSTEILVAATSQTLHAFTRKGRPVFTLETNLVEPIQHLCVTDNEDLLVTNSYVYNHYRDGKEVNYYLSTDKINALAVLPSTKVPSLTPLLACQDSAVYSLRDSSVRNRLLLDAVPVVLKLYRNDGGASGEWFVFGASDGHVGLVRCSRAGPTLQWTLPGTDAGAAVTSLDFYDVRQGGTGSQLLVGRADGTVQVYEFTDSEAEEEERCQRPPPTCIFSHNYNDSIASVRGGVIGLNGCPEILVATNHGWIFGLTTDLSASGQTREEVIGASEQMVALANQRLDQLETLKAQVADLEAKLDQVQEHGVADSGQLGTMMHQLNITADIDYLAGEDLYLLSLHSRVSIDFCLINCEAKVTLLDVERNTAILSVTESEKDELVATFRCQSNTTRLDFKIRSIERSTNCRLRLYVSPSISPRCSVVKTVNLPCLSRHVRCHNFAWAGRPHSQLIFKGAFSMADVHSWIHMCLPNISEKVPAEDQTGFFVHSQWNTGLTCQYKKGEAAFRSDNIASLSLVRDFISAKATAKNLHLSIVTAYAVEATEQLVKRIHPQLLGEIRRQHLVKLGRILHDAVTDQIAQNTDQDWMGAEFKQLLAADQPDSARTTPSASIEDYHFLADLYNSHWAFEGQPTHQVPGLFRDQLMACTTDQLLDSFQSARCQEENSDAAATSASAAAAAAIAESATTFTF